VKRGLRRELAFKRRSLTARLNSATLSNYPTKEVKPPEYRHLISSPFHIQTYTLFDQEEKSNHV
jgi:hypothetical protein